MIKSTFFIELSKTLKLISKKIVKLNKRKSWKKFLKKMEYTDLRKNSGTAQK